MEFIGDVYEPDQIAKEVAMNSLERLKLHQCFSRLVIDTILGDELSCYFPKTFWDLFTGVFFLLTPLNEKLLD